MGQYTVLVDDSAGCGRRVEFFESDTPSLTTPYAILRDVVMAGAMDDEDLAGIELTMDMVGESGSRLLAWDDGCVTYSATIKPLG